MTTRARWAARDQLPERVWAEMTPVCIGAGMYVPGPVSFHHEWWHQISVRRFEQRHEEITSEQFGLILARLRGER